jgi:hypothetical protein
MSQRSPIESRLRGLRPAGPPAGLEERVLAAAAASPLPRPPSWSDRLWSAPAPRLAWLAAVLVLLIVQILGDRSLDRRIEASFGRAEDGERAAVVELARELEVSTMWRHRPAPRPASSSSRGALGTDDGP